MATTDPSLARDRSAEAEPPRLLGLDGLRGVAAFVVLLSHTCLLVPALANAYAAPALVERWSPAWWAAYSPLHVLWDGSAAVFVFFVLSGFVLGLPFASNRGGGWARYYPRRLIRLYLPVFGAFLVALASLKLVDRIYPADATLWLRAHPADVDTEELRRHLFLFPSGTMGANGVLWTLRYEVIFSLVLPVVVLFCRHLPRLNALKAVLLLWVTGAYFTNAGPDVKFLMPIFVLGTLLAFERERVQRLADRIRGLAHPTAVWAAITAAIVIAISNAWWLRGITTDQVLIQRLARPSLVLTVAGAAAAVGMAAAGPWRDPLARSVPRWMGRRSFSLYLVHEPIVVALGVGLGARPSLWVALAVAVPLCLLAADLFYRAIERPSHQLARRVGGTPTAPPP